MRAALLAESALSGAQLAGLPPRRSPSCNRSARVAALLLGLTHEALANASGRFTALQQLIDAIGAAADHKAALDLQARISAEAGMLQNERTKLRMLFQGVHADERPTTQRTRELDHRRPRRSSRAASSRTLKHPGEAARMGFFATFWAG